MTALAIIAAVCIASFVAVAVLCRLAPNGWEDARGFHLGPRPPVKFHSIHNEASNL